MLEEKDMLKYSIIIPIYNAQKTIRACLDSILAQESTDYEILLINDGSTDSSEEICQSYHKEYSQISYYTQINSGVSTARNKGLEHAKGKWITFIDADDAIMPDFLPKKEFTTDLLVQNWKYDNLESNEFLPAEEIVGHERMFSFCQSHLDKHLFRTPWAKFFRRDIIEQHHIRFDKRFRLGEDTLFVLRYLACCQSMSIIASSFYLYTSGGDNKYKLSVKESLAYLKVFYYLYKKIPYKCKNLLLFKYFYFRGRTIGIDTLPIRIRWKVAPVVIKIKRDLGYSFFS